MTFTIVITITTLTPAAIILVGSVTWLTFWAAIKAGHFDFNWSEPKNG